MDKYGREAEQAKQFRRFAVALGVLILGGAALALSYRLRTRRERQAMKRLASRSTTPVAKPGDILLFFRPNRSRDYLIKWVTGSRFYHVALWAAPGQVVEARPKGVVEEGLEGREDEYIVVPAPQNRGEAALVWARTQQGAPFDTDDLIVVGLEHLFRHWKINYTKPGYYTCSELVVCAYRQAGVPLLPEKELSEIAPGDLAILLDAEEDGSGTMTDGLSVGKRGDKK